MSLTMNSRSNMSDTIIKTTALLAGTREAIVGILNRAFSGSSMKEFRIADDDSIETINSKISAANEHMSGYHTAFTLMDYLDLQSKINSPFENIVLSYIDEEEPDGSENYDANPVDVSAEGDVYILRIVSAVHEGQHTYTQDDWNYWCAMLSVTDGCLINMP